MRHCKSQTIHYYPRYVKIQQLKKELQEYEGTQVDNNDPTDSDTKIDSGWMLREGLFWLMFLASCILLIGLIYVMYDDLRLQFL